MAVPEAWTREEIGSLLASCTYGVNSKCSPQPVGLPVLRMGNIQDHRLDLSELKYADLSDQDQEKVTLRRDDVLFNRTNSYDLVGKVALVNTDEPLSYASYLLRLRTNESAVPAWLHYLLSSPAMQGRLRAIATKGVSQSNINPTKMRALKVEVPTLPEQQKIAAILSSVPNLEEQAEIEEVLFSTDERLRAERATIAGLRRAKSALMSVLLTGEVRVQPEAAE